MRLKPTSCRLKKIHKGKIIMDQTKAEGMSALVVFLAHKDEIKSKLEAGYSCRQVHALISSQLVAALTYRHFLRLCDRYLPNSSQRKKHKPSEAKDTVTHSHSEHKSRTPVITFKEVPKINQMSISTIGKDYLLERARD
jgi:hypothetical protein